MKAPHAGLTNHCKKAHRLLEELQARVKLLYMLAVTVSITSDVFMYNVPGERPGAIWRISLERCSRATIQSGLINAELSLNKKARARIHLQVI